MEPMADGYQHYMEAMKETGLAGSYVLPPDAEIDGSRPDILKVVDMYSAYFFYLNPFHSTESLSLNSDHHRGIRLLQD